jgi:DNA processing protein
MTEHGSSLVAWLNLSLAPGMTGAAGRKLIGSPASVLSQSQRALTRVVDSSLAAAISGQSYTASSEAALRWAQVHGRAILTLEDPRYPTLLLESPDPPPLLYAQGHLELLHQPALAIVGSRNATAQGMRNAETFARQLAQSGLCIVSGMALGIDSAAHRAALSESGSTIAVLGNGIDIVYPRRNADLLAQVSGAGLVLSEFPLATPPIAANFPRRNRIISGIAHGCLVIEAALASGSLITARAAVDAGRDVFAVPGSIHSPLSRGCHYLIKQGAKLVESAHDVLDELGVARLPVTQASRASPAFSGDVGIVMDALGYDPCGFDALIMRTRMRAEQLLALLMQLEIDAHITRNQDGSYQRLV